jgi:hypothetical protein
MNILELPKFLMFSNKHTSETLDDVIKTCENLHVEEQHQLKTLLQNYDCLFDGTLGNFNLEFNCFQMKDPNCKPISCRKMLLGF